MKTWINQLVVLSVLLACADLSLPGQGMAQTFTTLHNFGSDNDGAQPVGGLVLGGDTLYGATRFVLQSATTLTNGGDWQDSSLAPAIVGNQKIVTVDTSNTAGFFRLRGP